MADDEGLEGALLSASLVDLVTGEKLDGFGEKTLACPASVWKLLTTSAALSELGPDFRFNTKLVYAGQIKGGILKGDLLIIGSGDPSLGSRHFGEDFDSVLQGWVSAVREAGIDSIEGKIIGNAAHLQGLALPRTRIWEDMANYYGTGIYGLNFNDNTYFVSFSTPDDPGLPAKVLTIYPEVPGLVLESEVESSTIQADRAFIFGSPMDTKRIVRGTLPAGRDRYTIKGSIPDPALFAAFHLDQRLVDAGIPVSQPPESEYDQFREPVTYKVIAEVSSPPLKDLVRHINLESDNLMAEGLLLQLGAKAGEASIEGGLDALRSFLKGIWGENARFFAYDGSGLSRFNSVSAKQICDLLVRANSNQVLKTHLLNELPRAGKEGSVKWFGLHTNLAGNTRLKSGSMEGVKAYAGVLTTYTGRELAFAIMVNNFGMPSVELRKKIEEWLIRAYGQF